MSRKEYLEKLKKTDPQFYNMMMQAADELNLEDSEEEGGKDIDKDLSSDEEEEDDPERGGAIFQPPTKLEVKFPVLPFFFFLCNDDNLSQFLRNFKMLTELSRGFALNVFNIKFVC